MRYALILAGGSSARYGRDKLDEQFLGKSVLQRCADTFLAVSNAVVVVGRRIQGALFAEGGATRFCSVQNGLDLLQGDGVVAIHDGARPFVSKQLALRLFAEAEQYGSAIPCLPVSDTLYCRSDMRAVRRDDYFTVQTPQVFDLSAIKRAYCAAKEGNFTDDSSVFAANGGTLHFAEGAAHNIKLTYDGDLPQLRIGNGYDVHPFAQGDGVVLGGVRIPFGKKLQGHSDADVLCHAICDAVLSASGNKDIGHQFPDSDPAYCGIDSTLLLSRCVALAAEQGFEVVNVSATVICQQPKIAPHIDKMTQKLAPVLGVTPSCVNISATTTEGLGSLGNGDGIAAQATALLRKF